MNWETVWRNTLGLGPSVPQWVVAALVLSAIYLVVVLPSGFFMAYLDRKLGADFQARVGPNRAGPRGLFQPFADLLKLLQKESKIHMNWKETAWLLLHAMALYSTVAVLPLGSLMLLVDTDMSALLPFWAALLLGFGTMLIGFSQGTVPGWFGGVRIAAQSLAGAFPAMIALLCAGMHAGSFRWSVLASVQGSSPLHWTVVSDPFQCIAFVVFVISGLVLLAVPPLDGGLSISDLHGGVTAQLSGRRLSLFRLGRFYGFFLWSIISCVLFLGAWNLPPGLREQFDSENSYWMIQVLELVTLLTKTFVLMLGIVWAARVNPRTRVDQITDFSWKVLGPFSLAALIGSGLFSLWRSLA